jgi:hypothetical protein
VKATLDHLGECAIADEATLKGHTDEFVKSLKVHYRPPTLRRRLTRLAHPPRRPPTQL